jgi:hypothetical protein
VDLQQQQVMACQSHALKIATRWVQLRLALRLMIVGRDFGSASMQVCRAYAFSLSMGEGENR